MKIISITILTSLFLVACSNQKECNSFSFVDFDTVLNDLKYNKAHSKFYNQFAFYDLLFMDLSAYNSLSKIDSSRKIDSTGMNAWQNDPGVIYHNPDIRSHVDLFCNKNYLNIILQNYRDGDDLSSHDLDSVILVKDHKALFSISSSNQVLSFLVTINHPKLKLQLVKSIIFCEEVPDEPIDTRK